MFLNVGTTVCLKKMTKHFDCCELPYHIHIEPSHDNEFFIGNETLAVATGHYCNARPPFTFLGNTSVTVNKCEDFDQKTLFTSKNGYTEEMRTHHLSQPCNRTEPTIQPQGRERTGVVVSVVLVVLALAVMVGRLICHQNTG